MVRRTVIFRGTVQGVGFRWTAVQAARGYHVTGTVRNLGDGTVELVAEGPPDEVARFVEDIRERMRTYITEARETEGPPTGRYGDFRVAH